MIPISDKKEISKFMRKLEYNNVAEWEEEFRNKFKIKFKYKDVEY